MLDASDSSSSESGTASMISLVNMVDGCELEESDDVSSDGSTGPPPTNAVPPGIDSWKVTSRDIMNRSPAMSYKIHPLDSNG